MYLKLLQNAKPCENERQHRCFSYLGLCLVLQLDFSGNTATVTMRRPPCICLLDIRRGLQQVRQRQHHQQQHQHDNVAHGHFAALQRLRTAAARAGACFTEPHYEAPDGVVPAATAANTTTVPWLLQWGGTPPVSTALAMTDLCRALSLKAGQQPQHHRPTAPTVTLECRAVYCTAKPLGCVAADAQCCFFAVQGSPRLCMWPLDGGPLADTHLWRIDTRALNAPGLLGTPSLLSPAWLIGRDPEKEVQQMALQQLHLVGPFLIAARRHERLQLLLLPLHCQQRFGLPSPC